MDYGARLINSYSGNEKITEKRKETVEETTVKKEIIEPHKIITSTDSKKADLKFLFNNVYPKNHDYTTIFSDKHFVTEDSKDKSVLKAIRQQLIRKVQHDKIPNLLV